MDIERQRAVEELFDQLADEPESEQLRSLEAVCQGDRELFEEVMAMLKADAEDSAILSHDAASLAGALLDAGNGPVVPGRFGRYIIQKYLGEGGMGAVYMAERDGLGDRVAVKFLHDPWCSPAWRERFAREQRTLAGLCHRSIARLYDAGVVDGTPWFAMEYVEGLTITEHSSRNHLGLRKRLELFRAACEAVSFAHRNLTVHLDLKPSNILVDSDSEVKLVDFGIARRLTNDGGEAERTSLGQRLLSLNYAAPEQIRGEPVDVQTDVHALGIVLYELLTGKPPADLVNVSAAELAEFLEAEPQPPSSSQTSAVQASRADWKDLDVLCLTAARRDKSRRYATVDDLIRDLDRFLNDEPLEAHPDSVRYRFGKFLSRNRRSLSATAAVTILLTGTIAFFTLRLVETRERAVSSEARMERIYRLMLNLFEGDDSAAGPAQELRVVTLLARGVREAETLKGQPDLQAELRHTFGGLYHKLGHLDRAGPLLVAAWNAQKSTLGADHPETIRTQLDLAVLWLDQYRVEDARGLITQALQTAKRRYAADSIEVARATAVLGKLLTTEGDYQRAIPLLDEAVKTLSKSPPGVELSEAFGDLANAHYYLGHVDVSQTVNLQGIALDRTLFGERHPNTAVGLYNLANIQLDRGDYRQGERLFRQSLDINQGWYGKDHPKTAANYLMVGRSIQYQGRLDEAADLYNQALKTMLASFGEDHPRVGMVESMMGELARDRNELDRAESQFRRAADIFQKAFSDRHEFYLHQLSNLGSVALAGKHYQEAETLLRKAVDGLSAVVPDQRYTSIAQVRLSAALCAQKRFADAEEYAHAAYGNLQRLMGPPAVELRDARKQLAAVYYGLNQPAKAEALKLP